MTIAAIHQPQYLPYLGFFDKINQSDLYIVLDDVQYLRRGTQNRNKIKTTNGWEWLTVPVIQSRYQSINEVRINQTAHWERKHLKTLEVNYGPAPYYESLMPAITEVLEQEHTSLSDLNMQLIRWTMDVLGIDTPMLYSSDLDVEGESTERLVNLCKEVEAGHYLSGSGGRRYMDLQLFKDAGMKVSFQDFEPPVYPQLFPEVGFIPNLSIIDVLFCCGPAAAEFLSGR